MDREYNFYFLDRDGVINTNGFVNSVDDFQFLPQSLEALKLLKEMDKKVFVITNQGGIEAGYLTEGDLFDIHAHMMGEVIAHGGWIENIYYCPHLNDHYDRKPNPGMINRCLTEYNLQNAKDECCFIGDWHTDWQAALIAGIQPIAVSCGRKWGKEQIEFIKKNGIPNYFSLFDAVRL